MTTNQRIILETAEQLLKQSLVEHSQQLRAAGIDMRGAVIMSYGGAPSTESTNSVVEVDVLMNDENSFITLNDLAPDDKKAVLITNEQAAELAEELWTREIPTGIIKLKHEEVNKTMD